MLEGKVIVHHKKEKQYLFVCKLLDAWTDLMKLCMNVPYVPSMADKWLSFDCLPVVSVIGLTGNLDENMVKFVYSTSKISEKYLLNECW